MIYFFYPPALIRTYQGFNQISLIQFPSQLLCFLCRFLSVYYLANDSLSLLHPHNNDKPPKHLQINFFLMHLIYIVPNNYWPNNRIFFIIDYVCFPGKTLGYFGIVNESNANLLFFN